MKIYISGAIHNQPEGADGHRGSDAFASAANMVSHLGHIPVVPHDIDPDHRSHGVNECPPGYALSVACYMRGDLRELLDCDAVLMIGEWHNSVGAQREHSVACWTGVPIYYSVNALPDGRPMARVKSSLNAMTENLSKVKIPRHAPAVVVDKILEIEKEVSTGTEDDEISEWTTFPPHADKEEALAKPGGEPTTLAEMTAYQKANEAFEQDKRKPTISKKALDYARELAEMELSPEGKQQIRENAVGANEEPALVEGLREKVIPPSLLAKTDQEAFERGIQYVLSGELRSLGKLKNSPAAERLRWEIAIQMNNYGKSLNIKSEGSKEMLAKLVGWMSGERL